MLCRKQIICNLLICFQAVLHRTSAKLEKVAAHQTLIVTLGSSAQIKTALEERNAATVSAYSSQNF